jgi:hypothetical protein
MLTNVPASCNPKNKVAKYYVAVKVLARDKTEIADVNDESGSDRRRNPGSLKGGKMTLPPSFIQR